MVLEDIRRQRLDALFDEPVDDPEPVLVPFDDTRQIVDLDIHRSRPLDPHPDGFVVDDLAVLDDRAPVNHIPEFHAHPPAI